MLLYNALYVRSEIWICACAIVVISIINFLYKSSRRNFPPGPWGLPIVGYIPFLSKVPHLHFIDLAKKYGDVFSLRMGSELVVILNNSASIKEAYAKQEFLGRSPNSWFSLFGHKNPFLTNEINMWQEHRRFVILTLKDIAVGKTKIEENIQSEINHFMEVLKSFNGQSINPPFAPSVLNNISSMVLGKKYDYDHLEGKNISKNLEDMRRAVGLTSKHMYFPWMKHVPFLMKCLGHDKTYEILVASQEIYIKNIEQHKETLDETNIRDCIDTYLLEMEQRKEKGVNTSFSDEALPALVSALFIAGTDTVSTTIAWLMHTMAGFPDVQEKVQNEILEVIGPDRNPEYRDLDSMPFSHAVILEIMRWKFISVLGSPRYTLRDTSVAGYDIPAGTIVLPNLWAAHHDPRVWEDPDSFKPERFLTPDGERVVKSPHFMPFSFGRRACPGENLAYMELFLYFASILQKFDIRFPEGCKPDLEGIYLGLYKPPTVNLRFIPRNL